MKKQFNEPQPIDIFIGSRVRERRQKLEWTLVDLGNRLNVSHQQIQKYEQGITRITAAILFELSEIFGVSINYFYEGYEEPSTHNEFDQKISVVRKSPLKIILVEDDPTDEMLIRSAILDADRPFLIHVLHNGRQLLDFLKNKSGSNRFPRPDVIFMNLTLPLLDGISALKEIKRDRTLQDIPIIVLSNSVDKKDLMDSYKNFASGYIKKTFDHKQFRAQISDSINYWSNICLPNM
mgnify:CR=1 FL=1